MQQCRLVSMWLLGSALVIYLASSVAGVGEVVVRTGQGSHPGPSEPQSNSTDSVLDHESIITGIAVVSYEWQHVSSPFLVTLWILVAGLGKMGM